MFVDTDVTLTLVVLVGSYLFQLKKVSGELSLAELLDLVKEHHHDGADAYLRNCPDPKMLFYRLQPPPAVKEFSILEDGTTVDNVATILLDVQKIQLSRLDVAMDVFGRSPNRREVSLYIEKPLGESVFGIDGYLIC